MSAITKVCIKDRTKSDGTTALLLRVTIDRKVNYLPLKKYVDPKFFDQASGRVIKGYPNFKKINFALDQDVSKANDIILNYELQNRSFTFEDFKNDFSGPKNNTFKTFATAELDNMAHRISKETKKHYKTEIGKVDTFKPNLLLSDITIDFLQKYEKYLTVELKNHTNTVFTSLKTLRTFVNIALNKKLIKEYPFKNFKLKKVPTNRTYLTIEELKKLEDLYFNKKLHPYQYNVLQYFLFACYTGLRFSDIQSFSRKSITSNAIRLTMNKTEDKVNIPLTEKAKKILETANPDDDKPFRVISNQKTNEYLEKLMEKVEIDKNITFHCARHTFATIAITLGIPEIVVSKLLGHKDIKTTMIYAKVVEDLKFKEMDKWDKM
jgi:integrase/recombinase XerC